MIEELSDNWKRELLLIQENNDLKAFLKQLKSLVSECTQITHSYSSGAIITVEPLNASNINKLLTKLNGLKL